MTIDTTWPDWYLDTSDDASIHESLRELARYANPVQTKRQGLGLGAVELQRGGSLHDQATALAERLVARRTRYTLEPFNPGRRRGQIIRTTQELFDGAGTCVDFAVTITALLNRERIPASIAIAIPTSDTEPAHAFVVVHAAGRGTPLPSGATFAEWAGMLTGPGSPWLLLDTTPLDGDLPGDLGERRVQTSRMLREADGTVHVVDTGPGSEQEALEFHLPPPAQRDLGITAYLPDPVAGFVAFPSHAPVRDALAAATGRVLLIGPSGAGKSTLALETAGRLVGHRGWFLEGSDDVTFQRSLAAAEAQSRGEEFGPAEKDNTTTRVARAHQRLAKSERPWVVVVDNADSLTGDLLALLPVPRPPDGNRPGDLLIVTSTDTERAPRHADQRTAAGARLWATQRLDRLTPDDTATVGGVSSALADEARLPGLLKIAQWSAGKLVGDAQRTAGPLRIVEAALATAAAAENGPAMRIAVEAAAFMPAERITLGWVARAAFDGDEDAATTALRVAEQAGLVERSRADSDFGADAPLWMHRLVRAAVAQLAGREAGLRTLAEWRGEPYGRGEIGSVHRFVMAGEAPTTRDGLLAAATVVDLWEGGGREAVANACELGVRYVDLVDGILGRGTTEAASVYVRGQLAVARQASHGDPTDEQLDAAVARCVAARNACTAIPGDRQSGPEADQLSLLAGRAAAMHGILLRTKAKRLPDEIGQLDLFREAISILWQSYRDREQAFKKPDGTLKPDPDRHVDRAWYNLGGAYVNVANILHRRNPSHEGEAAIAAELSNAMESYAGSLSLRRGEPTNYTAASLWGVGLVSYSAALYCSGKLDLSNVVPTDELSRVLAEPTRTNLLLAAEHCVTAALRIWTELNGSPDNARKLLLKLSLAWAVKDADPADWAKKVKKALEPVLEDLEIEDFYART